MSVKTLDTLVYDIEQVILGKGGWDATITEFLSTQIASLAEARFAKPQKPRTHLSLSQLGKPCNRQLWYQINMAGMGEPLGAEALGTFFYGDLLEALVLALAKAAGHKVEGLQTNLVVDGIPGSRDAVIDGVTVDVKSASTRGFEKFAKGNLREDDPFGYISQLSSYVYAGKDDDLVEHKTKGAFLVVRKERFKLCLDQYDFTEEIKKKPQEIVDKKAMVAGPMPARGFSGVPQSKTSPNLMLPAACSYCDFKKQCWPDARVFLYSSGPTWLTKVVKEPNVMELIV